MCKRNPYRLSFLVAQFCLLLAVGPPLRYMTLDPAGKGSTLCAWYLNMVAEEGRI